MDSEKKYMTVTVKSYPIGFETKYFYLPKMPNFFIGNVITSSDGKQYRVIDGRTHVSFEDIDLNKYQPFVWLESKD